MTLWRDPHLKTTKTAFCAALPFCPSNGLLGLFLALLVAYLSSHSYCLKTLLTTLFGTHMTSSQGSALLNRSIMQACLNQSNSFTCILILAAANCHFLPIISAIELSDLLWLSVTFCHSCHSYHCYHSSGYSCCCGYSRFNLATPNTSLNPCRRASGSLRTVETEFLLVLLAIFVCFLALHLLGTDLGLRGLCPLH